MAKEKMSPEEEAVQRALGTLPKFEVQVTREITRASFARVLVVAADPDDAEARALQIIKDEGEDDTGQRVAWADNQEGDAKPPTAEDVRQLGEDDYLIHRFDKENVVEEEKIDPSVLGKIM